MIKVNENAKTHLSSLMSESGFDINKDYVRVQVKSGGCSGLSYDLSFDHNKSESDQVFEDTPVKIIVDKKVSYT